MHSNYFIWSFNCKVVAELEAFQAKVAETEQNSCFWGWGLGWGLGRCCLQLKFAQHPD